MGPLFLQFQAFSLSVFALSQQGRDKGIAQPTPAFAGSVAKAVKMSPPFLGLCPGGSFCGLAILSPDLTGTVSCRHLNPFFDGISVRHLRSRVARFGRGSSSTLLSLRKGVHHGA